MPGLITNNLGVVSYNGHTFTDPLHAKVSITPVYTRDGRSVKYNRVALTIEAIVEDAITGSTDDLMEDLFARLTKPGGVLKFTYRGFGENFVVNTGSNKYDVMHGPTPRILSWEPLGHFRACRIAWTVECHLIRCDDYKNFEQLLELSYEMDWDLSENGILSRTIQGSMEIATQRRGTTGNYLNRNASQVQTVLRSAFPTLVNFTRSQNYSLSEDRRMLNFRISDREIESDNPWFPGTYRPQARYRVGANLGNRGGLRIFTASLSGTIEWLPGATPVTALNALSLLVQRRLTALRSTPGTGTEGYSGYIIMQGIEFEEEVWKRSMGFSLSWTLNIQSLDQIFTVSQMFYPYAAQPSSGKFPPPFSTAKDLTGLGMSKLWKAENDRVISRGTAKVNLDPGQDPSVNACDYDQPGFSDPSQLEIRPIEQYKRVAFPTKCPPREVSWVDVENDLELIYWPDQIVSSVGYTPSDDYTQRTDLTAVIPGDGKYIPAPAELRTYTPDVVHEQGPGTYWIVMRGKALRAGYKISRPELTKYGGMKPISLGGTFENKRVKRDPACPMYAAVWEWWYRLPKPPTIDVLENITYSSNIPPHLLNSPKDGST